LVQRLALPVDFGRRRAGSRQVGEISCEQAAMLQQHLADGERDRKQAAVGPHGFYLNPTAKDLRRPGMQIARQPFHMTLAQRQRHDQRADRPAHGLRPPAAKGLLGSWTELDHGPGLVDRDDAVRGG
jgi:hypothetical protein